MRMPNGFRIPRYFNVVMREVDTYGLSALAMIGLVKFFNTNVSGMILTDDQEDMFLQMFEQLMVTKAFLVGNPFLQSSIGVNAILSMQQLLPNLSCLSRDVPLWVKALIDQIGPDYADGVLYLPQISVNAYGTIANTTVTNWQLFPKYGSVTDAATGISSNRYIGGATGSIAFPFVGMSNPVSNASGISPATGSTTLYSGAGQPTDEFAVVAGRQVMYAPENITALNSYNAARVLSNVGTFNPNFIFWQAAANGMFDFVESCFTTQEINMRGTTGKCNGASQCGGPAMLAIQISVPRNDTVFQRTANGHYSVTQNALVKVDNNAVYQPYVPIKYNYFAPLSPVDVAISMAFPICVLYKDNAVPYTLTTAYASIEVKYLSNAISNDAIEQFLNVEGPVVKDYVSEAGKNHSGHVAMLRTASEERRQNQVRDCLRKSIVALGNRIAANLQRVDWVKIAAGTCRSAVSLAGIGWARPGCALIPKIYKQYKSIRDNYDSQGRGDALVLPKIAASH